MPRVAVTYWDELASDFGASESVGGFQVNEGNLNGSSFSKDDNVVNAIGKGIAGRGNATFETNAEADEFHWFLEDLRAADLVDEVLTGNLDWNSLAEGSGAKKSRDLVGSVNYDNVWDNAIRIKQQKDGDYAVQIGGKGIGGNAMAEFESLEDARAFEKVAEAIFDLGLADEMFL